MLCPPGDVRDNEEVLVKVVTFTGAVIALHVPLSITVIEIRKTLQHYAECCYVTQYGLVARDGTVLSDLVTLGQQCRGKAARVLQMVFTPYSYNTMRDHILQLRELHGQDAEGYALTCASVDETAPRPDPLSYPNISRTSIILSMSPPGEPSDLCSTFNQTDILTSSPASQSSPIVLSTTTMSAPPNPPQPLISTNMSMPPPSSRIRGDLMYFTVTFNKQTLGVAGTYEGFRLLSSDDFSDTTTTGETYQTLLGLLYHVIPGQKERYEELMKVRVMNSRHEDYAVFPAQEWLVGGLKGCVRDVWKCREHEYSVMQPQDPRFSQRNWCTQWVECESAIDQVFGEFIAACRQTVMLAVDGTLLPSEAGPVFEEQLFLFNGIAVVFCGSTTTSHSPSWSSAHKDLILHKFLSPYLAKGNIFTLPMCSIDYHGYRAWCIGVSFEIFDKHGQSKLAYRQQIEPDAPMSHEKTQSVLSSLEKYTNIQINEGEPLPSIYEGRDGRMYIENPHLLLQKRQGGGLVRPELCDRQLHRCTEETSVSSCGTNELASSENSIVEQHTAGETVEGLVRDIIEGTVALGDPVRLTKIFHERGVPMRMLGQVEGRLPVGHGERQKLRLEALLRAGKRGLRNVIKPLRGGVVSPQLAEYLNNFFVDADELTSVQQNITKRVAGHFGVENEGLWEWRRDPGVCWYMLRGLCLKVGVVVKAREFAWGGKKVFTKGDVCDVVAMCYRLLPATNRNDEEAEVVMCVEQATKLAEMKDDINAARATTQLIHEISRHHGADSPALISPLFSLATSFLRLSLPSAAGPIFARAANIAFVSTTSSSPDYIPSVLNHALCAVESGSVESLRTARATLRTLDDNRAAKYLEAVEKKLCE